MNDRTFRPTTPTGHDPRRLTGVPAIDGPLEEPFKLTTQVGTVDLVILDNEGEAHKVGEAEVEPGHITAHIDDDSAVRYLSGGTITLDRLDLLAEHSYPVEPILVHAPEGQIRVGHTCDMPGGLQITITDRAMRGPMMAALAEIKTAALAKFVFTHKQRLAALREMLRQARGSSAQMTEAIEQALGQLGNGSAEVTPAQPVKGVL